MIAGLLLALAGPVASAQDAAWGEVLAALGGCQACHTAAGGAPYAGGYAVETRFGTFVGPNLTPDPQHGLGAWTQDDFVRAMREGRAPDGHAYWPAFPYASFTRTTDEDLADLWAYLRTVPPVATPDLPHDIKALYSGGLGLWRSLAFRPGPLELPPDTAPDVARGAYLVASIGHCGECHTPRSGIGKPIATRAMGGNDDPPEPAPNISPHPQDGIGEWSHGDVVSLLELGMEADGNFVGGYMLHLVETGTSRLPPEDRDAIAAYLLSLPPVSDQDRRRK